jgi:hypothetical protein
MTLETAAISAATSLIVTACVLIFQHKSRVKPFQLELYKRQMDAIAKVVPLAAILDRSFRSLLFRSRLRCADVVPRSSPEENELDDWSQVESDHDLLENQVVEVFPFLPEEVISALDEFSDEASSLNSVWNGRDTPTPEMDAEIDAIEERVTVKINDLLKACRKATGDTTFSDGLAHLLGRRRAATVAKPRPSEQEASHAT